MSWMSISQFVCSFEANQKIAEIAGSFEIPTYICLVFPNYKNTIFSTNKYTWYIVPENTSEIMETEVMWWDRSSQSKGSLLEVGHNEKSRLPRDLW